MAVNIQRGMRIDLAIASLALLASASASIATVVQTRTIANQLSASVWPYLSFSTQIEPHGWSASIVNEGLGPALVRTFAVSLNGRPQSRYRTLVSAVDSNRHGLTVVSSDLGGGVVIRPGETFSLLQVSDAKLEIARAMPALRRADATLCYCSLLGNCWTLHANQTEPQPVGACGAPTKPVTY